ncbi:MAG: 1-(5-phosphoribosyl)-5-[(5-phosphoribosylamino)methylideneamino]imidazole-4-carboxamide isomerase [Ruminococcaceae bacterium]|nr:1-(5-phosphoribosyl)-5-[(5-phosphoribosylamino)methylideneamino]imidazole-4-carboxamide isomerase [Oscillospiraceae bacterium]
MLIFPAIDLYDKKAVRLLKGDYAQMTVYSDDPVSIALDFKSKGAQWIHIVDLEGAKDGTVPNLDTVCRIKKESGLKCEIGGGIRNMERVRTYIENGLDRVILGTAAVTEAGFAEAAVKQYGDKIAIGVDIKDGFVALKGWVEKSQVDAFDFCARMEAIGVKTIICTDISKDGAMQGTNRELYAKLKDRFKMQITASGGVSSIEDVRALREKDLYGAIIGKAYYTKAIDLLEAIEVAK